jgi:hypothetical protein
MKGTQANLAGEDLSRAFLKRADLESGLFRGTNFFEANLSDVCFEKADLEGAILTSANLERGNLVRANLKNARLINANLKGANLTGVSFENADLDSAILIDTYLIGVALSEANLDNVVLLNSWIDYRTLASLPPDLIDRYGDAVNLIGGAHSKHSIVRSIEFPPEYLQAGISILHSFGDYIRKKYPTQEARVTIEQDGLRVSMKIDTLKGEPEVIEEALDEYGLVVTGRKAPKDVTDDPDLIISLRNELRFAKARIESQRELLEFHASKTHSLENLLYQLINKSAPLINVNIPVKAQASSSSVAEQSFDIGKVISEIQGIIREMNTALRLPTAEAKKLKNIHDSLEGIKTKKGAGELVNSPELSNFRRFLHQLSDRNSELGKVIRGIKTAGKLAQELGRYYNEIAQWCGMPQIPDPLLGRNNKL